MAFRITGTGFEDLPVNNLSASGTVSLPPTTSIGDVSDVEISYIDNVTSAIQTQLNAKAPSTGIAQSAITNLTTDLASKAPINSPNFTGIVTADNYDIGLTTLNSDSIALNFSSETGLYTRSAAGTITFTASNYRAGAIKTVRIVPGASSRTLNFPTNWVFMGTKPATIAANKIGILTVTSFGTTESDCVAAWTVQI